MLERLEHRSVVVFLRWEIEGEPRIRSLESVTHEAVRYGLLTLFIAVDRWSAVRYFIKQTQEPTLPRALV
jgi:hypothetical protein